MSALRLKHVISPGRLAARMGVTPQNVSNWQKRGIPADRVIDVSRATEWQVTPHELRPDLYPHSDDGLPEGRRRRCR